MSAQETKEAGGGAGSRWQTLYTIGGAAALFSFLLIPIQLVVYASYPPPTTVTGWFTLFQESCLWAR